MPMTKDEVKSVNQNTANLSSSISNKAGHGFVFGAALAISISWSVNKSIIWALAHGFFSWAYVVYYGLGFGR